MKPTILHFGLGAFHRAHQAVYTEDAGGWRIEAVSMRDPSLADAIETHPSYTLVTRAPDGPTLRQIDVIERGHALSRGAAPIVERLADPAVQVVTITVTEKGYGLDRATGGPDHTHPTMAHDLATPEAPRGLIGTLLLGLAARKAADAGPLTIISCDNLPDNGRVLERLIHLTAARAHPDLRAWITQTCTFPNTMVDRITPATSDATLELVRTETGRTDPLAVETEPFTQWVIEDRFAGPIPDWQAVGAEVVAEVAPYEMMKLRMLNGAHSAIAYMGALAGHAYVRDVMADRALMPRVRAVMDAAARTLPATLDTSAYARALIDRFANPTIDHRCLQIAMDGSQKMPQRIFAPVRDLLPVGGDVTAHAQATAAWLRYLRTAEGISDPLADALQDAARQDDPVSALVQVPGLDGTDVFADARWKKAVRQAL
ncbi:mannitol dehydrogenase [Jannaschia pagri]|uniref:Mannitol dehydrogenase n=1 Tax=Jannaschia pagri TaxID=2829797 RepID=A0ABQ4NMJ2_9RHOB|nr:MULTISPECIES: mannitol dehydrogenase family protein [unclassified Jannaschia]GIT91610.1 mannitol dehydrogenase [Jannaschia sp. AI_61]GIT95444.1 mannitol dehydrogenase [Jannaschia sp. AI_62]